MATQVHIPEVAPPLPAPRALGAPLRTLYDSSIRCVSCGATWEERDEDEYTSIDGDIYCTQSRDRCAQAANERFFRETAAETLAKHIDLARAEIEQDERIWPCEIEDAGHPYALLDDLSMRARLFGEGRDTGFRSDGVMLDYDELLLLRTTLRSAVDAVPAGAIRDAVAKQYFLTFTHERRTEGVAL